MSNVKSSVIRPGLLVQLRTSIDGYIEYQRQDLTPDAPAPEDSEVTTWTTTKIVNAKDEYELAVKTRTQAQQAVRRCCFTTDFGLVCPPEAEGMLTEGIAAARRIVEAFNAKAQHGTISVNALCGRVASNDAEAARAITSQIAALCAQMDRGISALDPEAIRKAATRARELSSMLDDSVKGRVDEAVKQARDAARAITKRITKDGETAAVVLADIQRGLIDSARVAFLDFETAPQAADLLPAIEVQRFAELMASDDETDDGDRKGPASAGPDVVRMLEVA